MEETERLIKHRICHLEQFYSLKPKEKAESPLPNSKELSAYLSGQLSLFPKGSSNTNLLWNRNKVDFIELAIALFESNSVVTKDKKKLTKKEFLQILMWFFNIQVGHWEGTLSAAKNRKTEQETPFLEELATAFKNYTTRSLK